MNATLSIRDLTLSFNSPRGVARVINGLSLELQPATIHGLVGESGSGKSVASRAILGLHSRRSLHEITGVIEYDGRNLLELTEDEYSAQIRGREIAMIFQDPMTALNPVMRVGAQIALMLTTHGESKTHAEARRRAVDLLDKVGIRDPKRVSQSYPNELSGGQRQRVMIAMALACRPRLLIADEPTTALDVTVQAQIMDLLEELRETVGLSILLVSHDLALIAERCDSVSVMYAGRVVEEGRALDVFATPAHPYTSALERARPALDAAPHTRLQTIRGTVADLVHLPDGCAFRDRCPVAVQACSTVVPALTQADRASRLVACHNPIASPPQHTPSTRKEVTV